MRGCVGRTDRIIRVLLGLVALGVGLRVAGPWSALFYALALVGLVTGVAGRCPLYALLGLQTCSASPRKS
ncbi:MAG: DUF2892 domain-containing protein [Armatimonadota bacterium]|nr:DUF2892 domain-containing protein [Armatimonadota bacterium]MDR7449704.1 DUF2892 domain-containing protein [Armatimonadota bacterium]MDR7458379.1 DUF2892 domain-containing protein [Armatimonadota bacterium]MDR7478817.1 DUF2892 domain-containing protein [Armatimonadota bacterium]MDR7488840.1 DUF2892 domain-containing protein [Armatimonadota bacterium]